MPFKMVDLTGQRFGRLRAMRPIGRVKVGPKQTQVEWLLTCDCGAYHMSDSGDLRSGHSQSCDCLRKILRGKACTTHGHTTDAYKGRSAEYRTWWSMVQRCTHPSQTNWKYYGGRGIKVCERWLKFENFLADMGSKPKGMTIERADSNGNYEPGNCKWATYKEQASNRSGIFKTGHKGGCLSDETKKKLSEYWMKQPPELRHQRGVAAARARWGG